MKRKSIKFKKPKFKKLKKEDHAKLGVLLVLIVVAFSMTFLKPIELFSFHPVNHDEWTQDVYAALKDLGGEASLKDLDKKVREVRHDEKRSTPFNLNSITRRTLEEHSSDSKSFKHGDDLFTMDKAKGKNVWAIRK